MAHTRRGLVSVRVGLVLALVASVSLVAAREGAGRPLHEPGPGRVDRAAAMALESMRLRACGGPGPCREEGRAPLVRSAGERWLARDKAKHAGYCFLGSLGAASWLHYRGMMESDCPGWAGASVFSLGVFKEVALDRHDARSKASWRDAVANLAGVLAAGLVWTLARES